MVSFGSASARQSRSNPFLAVLMTALFTVLFSTALYAAELPDANSGGSQTTSFFNITDTVVVPPCGAINFTGSLINASNASQALGSYNVTAYYNSTTNASVNVTGGFSFNLTAPCSTQGLAGGFALDNLTLYTNSSDNHSKHLHFFVSNATNVSVVLLSAKPPFALSSNNTINITYFNGSSALANNLPFVRVLNSSGQIEPTNVQVYNLTNKTDSNGIIQYNVSVGSNALGSYTVVVDYGLASLGFETQTAYDLLFLTQTVAGESRSSFAGATPISLIVKSRYANGTAFDIAGSDYVTAFITFPNSTVYALNLSATNASTNPGANNFTFNGATIPGAYKVRVEGHIQGSVYQTRGYFEIRTGFARLAAGSDFFQNLGDKSVILPGQSVRFNVLLYNNSDDSLVAGNLTGNTNQLNCSAITLNGFTDLSNGQNASWNGIPTVSTVQYAGSTTVCALTVGVPSAQGDYRINATLTDPTNSALKIPSEGIIQVRTYGLRLHICPAVSEFMPCGFVPFFEKNKNATFQFSIDNFSSGQQLGRSNFLNVTGISVRKFTFGTGSSSENTNWTQNSSYYLQYPQTDSNAIRLVLTLPNDNSTGPEQVQLSVNTSVGILTSKEFFMVKGSTVEAHGGPSSGSGFNPQISCNGTFPFFVEAFDLKTNQPVQGVSVNGIKSATHVISGRILDSTYITSMTTNSTDSNGQATFNVTFNTSKSFLPGPYAMVLNISYNGDQDEAFSGFMCGSGSFDLFKPGGFGGDQPGPGGQGGGPGGMANQGGITGFPNGQPPHAGASGAVSLSFQQVGFGGQSFGNIQGPGNQGFGQPIFNGTLKVTGINYFNRDTGSGRTIPATNAAAATMFNVTNGNVSFSLVPNNFNLTAWPQGFIQLQVNFTNGSIPGIERGPSGTGQLPGFDSSAYRVFVDFSSLPPSVSVGRNVSILVNVSTNVSLSGNNFTARMQSFTSGSQVPATVISATKLADNWNSGADDALNPPGAEQWNVTVTVPNMDVGPVKFILTINNSASVTNTVEIPTQITGLEMRPLSGFLMFMTAFCNPLDGVNQNGTLQSCQSIMSPSDFGGGGPGQPTPYTPSEINFASRMNFSVFNNTYNVSSKSGTVCYKGALNYTGGNMGFGTTASLSNTTFVAVIDNQTPGSYNTVVFNNTQGNVTVVSLSNLTADHRGFNRFNTSWSDMYVSMTEGCNLVKLANVSEVPVDTKMILGLGRNPVNDKFDVAYKVLLGGSPLTGAGVDLMGVANTTYGSNRFINMLSGNQFVTRSSTSGNGGIAFVEANITIPGVYLLFWKVNASIGGQTVQSFAKLQQDTYSYGGGGGNQVEIAAFNAFCGGFTPQPITRGNQNLTTTCNVNAFNNTNLANANITLTAQDFNGGSPISLTLSNSTTGLVSSVMQTGQSGSVTFNFTMPGNWTQGHGYQITGSATVGSTVQQFPSGGIGFFGGSGNFGRQGP